MHKEILSEEQVKYLYLVAKFKNEFGLVGGTAIALQIGHRRSIDFDLFKFGEFDNKKIRSMVKRSGLKIRTVYKEEKGQFTFMIGGVQFTFYNFPYKINYSTNFEKILIMPDLLSLAAMKAFALGQRAKWKDYVDLYFIVKEFYTLDEICKQSKKLFQGEFNQRIFREQLAYFEDIDYREEVDFLPGFEVNEKKIKKSLIDFSLA